MGGTGRTVEVKQTLEKEQKRLLEGFGRETKTEGRAPLERCVIVGGEQTGSNMH